MTGATGFHKQISITEGSILGLGNRLYTEEEKGEGNKTTLPGGETQIQTSLGAALSHRAALQL